MIQNGEGSGIEFKRDEVENRELAAEVVAFANFRGGRVLLGVEDDGTVHGTTRRDLEEWVAELCRARVAPPLIPYFDWFREFEPGKDVAVLQVLPGPDKPYARLHNSRRTYYIRVGSTKREATREELARMFQESGQLRYGVKPVPGATLADLDRQRLRQYLVDILGGEAPDDTEEEAWTRLLANLEFVVEADDVVAPTIDGVLLFGENVERFLPQAGIRALAYAGTERDYATRADEDLRGPILPLRSPGGEVVESGLVEQALAFVGRNTTPTAHLEGARRVDRPTYPAEVLREAIVNAVVHRDYSVAGTDVTLSIFDDRLEVESPGRLPNTVTVERMRAGFRYTRNQTLVNVMRDYGYVDFRGMGVRSKIVPGMLAHNGTEPELVEEEPAFIVRLLA
jgi:ATP-dependent DNA helicase RecG